MQERRDCAELPDLTRAASAEPCPKSAVKGVDERQEQRRSEQRNHVEQWCPEQRESGQARQHGDPQIPLWKPGD